jgi:hypothetical protein
MYLRSNEPPIFLGDIVGSVFFFGRLIGRFWHAVG